MSQVETPGVGTRQLLTGAQSLVESLERVGVDFAAVDRQLEAEGVEKFETAWTGLLDSVSQALTGQRR